DRPRRTGIEIRGPQGRLVVALRRALGGTEQRDRDRQRKHHGALCPRPSAEGQENDGELRYPERMDDDLESMTRRDLIAEVKKLRQGIRTHRDSTGQDLCWHHPALWSLLPEKSDPLPVVPDWPQFLQGCIRYRQSLDEQAPEAP